jgi:hypothetical protein
MRRNYQRLPQKRDEIKSNPKDKRKSFYKDSNKNSEILKLYVAELLKTKAAKEIINMLIALLLELIFILLVIFLCQKKDENMQQDVILRQYTEVLKGLEEEPADISVSPYQCNMPSIVQKDIEKMLEMGENACVIYENDMGDKIIIKPSKEAIAGYRITFDVKRDPLSLTSMYELEDNISFYRNGDTLVIYGGERNIRRVERYYMNSNELDYELLDNSLVDLFGTNIETDSSRYFNDYSTLIRIGSEFSFYRLGERIYTAVFQGGEIKEWNYYYIITTNNDCYNMYYSVGKGEESWIKFYKIIEDVDEVLYEEEISVLDENGNSMEFPIFRVGNKKYAQIPHATAERAYGQNYGRNNKNTSDEKPNFVPQLVEVSTMNSSKVQLVCERNWRSEYLEWYVQYYFEAGGREGYIQKRINGLDSEVSRLIPQEKLDMFRGKVILPDEVEEYINQLRLLYDEYTDNKF